MSPICLSRCLTFFAWLITKQEERTVICFPAFLVGVSRMCILMMSISFSSLIVFLMNCLSGFLSRSCQLFELVAGSARQSPVWVCDFEFTSFHCSFFFRCLFIFLRFPGSFLCLFLSFSPSSAVVLLFFFCRIFVFVVMMQNQNLSRF